MYDEQLKLLNGSNRITNICKTISLDENDVISISCGDLVVLKYYPNDDYSVHGSRKWNNDFIRGFMGMYSPFRLHRTNFNPATQSKLMYIGLCADQELFSNNLNVSKPQLDVISIKEGFLVSKAHKHLGSIYLMSMGQNLDFIKNVCNKMAGIILTKETSILTTSNINSLIIWFLPQQKKLNISIVNNDTHLREEPHYFLEQNTYSAVEEYLNYSLKDYTAPEGYEYNPLVIKYTLPLNLANNLEQIIILADILGS